MEENGMDVDWSVLDESKGDSSEFPTTIQFAFLVWNYLTDQWDGMSGSYFGKQMSGIQDIMNILQIEDRAEVLKIVKIIDGKYMETVNKKDKIKPTTGN